MRRYFKPRGSICGIVALIFIRPTARIQESQIDLESPHMDPAVVMVQGAKQPHQRPPGIPTQTFTNQASGERDDR
jgi:hypothetical protein